MLCFTLVVSVGTRVETNGARVRCQGKQESLQEQNVLEPWVGLHALLGTHLHSQTTGQLQRHL